MLFFDLMILVDCDLWDFQFMLFDIVCFFGLEFYVWVLDGEWRVGFILWFKFYYQVLVGSLFDDDVVLVCLVEYGCDLKFW